MDGDVGGGGVEKSVRSLLLGITVFSRFASPCSDEEEERKLFLS